MGLVTQSIDFGIGLITGPIAWIFSLIRLHTVAYRIEQWKNGIIGDIADMERGINQGFTDFLSPLTNTFGGPFLRIRDMFRAFESGFNGVADVGLAIARALDPVISQLNSQQNMTLPLIDVTIPLGDISMAIGGLFTLFDVFLDLLFGGIWHAMFTVPAAVGGFMATIFDFFARISILEASVGFLGLIILAFFIPAFITGALSGSVYAPFNLGVLGVAFALYPITNLFAMFLMVVAGAFFVFFALVQDNSLLAIYGGVTMLTGTIGMFFALKIGLVATIILTLGTIYAVVYFTETLERRIAPQVGRDEAILVGDA